MAQADKIPKAMAEKFAAISTLTDSFCVSHLDDEYRRPKRKQCGIDLMGIQIDLGVSKSSRELLDAIGSTSLRQLVSEVFSVIVG